MADEKSNEDITSKKDEELTEVETTEVDEVDDILDVEDEDNEVPTIEDYKKLQEKNKELFIRAKKAEAQAKAKKEAILQTKKETPDLSKTEVKSEVNIDDKIDIRFLQSDGLSSEEIDLLQVIKKGQEALGKTITLIEAKSNPLYTAYLAQKELQEKQDQAQLKPSGGKVEPAKEESDYEFEKKRKEAAEKILSQM